jgi:hypothetical protein
VRLNFFSFLFWFPGFVELKTLIFLFFLLAHGY